jgi:hypothetical protein
VAIRGFADGHIYFLIRMNVKSNLLILLSITCLVLSAASNEVSLSADSSLWPPKVKLINDLFVSDAATIPAGRHAVLIRVEDDERNNDALVLDFGSRGIQRVTPDLTDIRQRVGRYESGQDVKLLPNWTMMLGRAFVRIQDGRVEPIKLSAISHYKYMLILYTDELDQPEFLALLDRFGSVAAACGEETMLVIMPQGLTGATESDDSVTLSRASNQEFFYVYPYLSDAFKASLAHPVIDMPALVLVDVEGKTLIDSAPLSECFDGAEFRAPYHKFFKELERVNP